MGGCNNTLKAATVSDILYLDVQRNVFFYHR